MTRLTKADLQAQLDAMKAENAALRQQTEQALALAEQAVESATDAPEPKAARVSKWDSFTFPKSLRTNKDALAFEARFRAHNGVGNDVEVERNDAYGERYRKAYNAAKPVAAFTPYGVAKLAQRIANGNRKAQAKLAKALEA